MIEADDPMRVRDRPIETEVYFECRCMCGVAVMRHLPAAPTGA